MVKHIDYLCWEMSASGIGKQRFLSFPANNNLISPPLTEAECRVIIDEAQCIKNKATRAAQGASHLQALTRFCMSGTPMMNNVGELYSLIHFLRIKPYNESERFNLVSFSDPVQFA